MEEDCGRREGEDVEGEGCKKKNEVRKRRVVKGGGS